MVFVIILLTSTFFIFIVLSCIFSKNESVQQRMKEHQMKIYVVIYFIFLFSFLFAEIYIETQIVQTTAYLLFFITIIAYYVFLGTNERTSSIINYFAIFASISFSFIFCDIMKTNMPALIGIIYEGYLYAAELFLMATVVTLSLQTLYTLEEPNTKFYTKWK